jgi:hypothetical protein
MFVFNRSAAAVLVPLALLLAVVLWSGRSSAPASDTATTVAQADEPRVQGS